MRDTVHCLTKEPADKEAITASVKRMVAEVQTYVPGYRLLNDPIVDGNRVTISVEVEGLGDFLPKYAGNLDIMTSAALKTAEMIARRKAQAA
jgi:acetaldehyde/propanal dehydrogenase